MNSKINESSDHKLIKERIALYLKQISQNQITEYPDSGHESDVFAVTYQGISTMTEIIWSLQKAHIYSDFLILSNSFANIKILIINHDFFAEKNKDKYKGIRRDYEKLRISEIRKGYIISEAFDSNLVIDNTMEEIKNFLDYSITLLSFNNKLNEKHLTDFKNYIVKPIISYLNDNISINIENIPQIGSEDLFCDYLKHFNLELQWKRITDVQERISSLVRDIECEFRGFCNDNNIPVVGQIGKVPYYSGGVLVGDMYPRTIDRIPIKDFVERLINLPQDDSFESVLDNRLTIENHPSENIIRFRMHETSAANISIMYQGNIETERIFNDLRQYTVDHRNSTMISTLKENEEKLRSNINKFKQSIERTLYHHVLPTNIECPFLKLI